MKKIQSLIGNVEKVIVGKRQTIEFAVVAMLARGHVLLEDVPGTGKTMLARALSRSVDVDLKRMQCTPDLLPSDVTGVPIFNQKTADFEFRPGPVFTNILLADEINRATPRAQSALLECMEEFRVSVDGSTYELPRLFMVLATQNPIDMAGTHPLPEAQLDRFLVRLSMGYPSQEEESRMLLAQLASHPIDGVRAVVTEDDILAAREAVRAVHLSSDIAEYIVKIATAIRQHADVRLGVSPRAVLALSRAAQGLAYLRDRDYVSPDLVKIMAVPVLAHRILLNPQAAARGQVAAAVIRDVFTQVPPPV